MAYVYVLGNDELEKHYKIGCTTGSVENRIKKLQTGNSGDLYVVRLVETDAPFKLELMLHNRFKERLILNEWYLLEEEHLKEFDKCCEIYKQSLEALKENPFFKYC